MTTPLAATLVLAALGAAAAPSAAATRVGEREPAVAAARRAIAAGDLAAIERSVAAIPAAAPERPELAWLAAHADGDPARIAAAAAAWCGRDPTGRACADAELYRRVPRMTSAMAGPVEVPLSPTAPLPVALARAGGRETGAILDTGASQTVVSTTLAEALGLEPTEAAFPVATPAGVAGARLALLPVLSVGGFSARNVPVLVMDLPQLEALGVSMILSPQQVFDGFTVRIDLATRRLRLSRDGLPAGGGTSIPYLKAGFDLAIEAQIGDGPPALFGIDTGMEGGYVVAADYQPAAVAAGGEVLLRSAGTAADVAGESAAPVRIGGLVLSPEGTCAVAPLPRTGPLGLSGMLGNGAWRGRGITLDTVARRIRIDPARAPAAVPARPPGAAAPKA